MEMRAEAQETCQGYKAANASCTTRYALKAVALEKAEAARDAARADAVGKDAATKRAEACEERTAKAAEHATRLAASKVALEKEVEALRTSSEKAVHEAGNSMERKTGACRAG